MRSLTAMAGSTAPSPGRVVARSSGRWSSRLASQHSQVEHAVLERIRVVLQQHDLPRPGAQYATLQLAVIGPSPTAEPGDARGIDAFNALDRRVDLAQVQRIAEGEEVRMEEAAAAVRQNVIAQRVSHGRAHVSAEVIAAYADLD